MNSRSQTYANMAQSDDQEHIIRGTVDRVTFSNSENGYAVLQVAIYQKKERLTVVGTLFNARPGVEITARGKYIEHSKFGTQFQAITISETVPTTVEGIQKYLTSGLIKGIGAKTAEKLVDTFGDKTLEILRDNPEEAMKKAGVKSGMKKNKLSELSEALSDQNDMGAIIQFLVEHNVSPKLAIKIYERFKNRSLEILSKDPYILARSLKGVGFKTADRIALDLGISIDSKERLRAGVYHALEQSSDDGHCYLTANDLNQKARHLLGISSELSLEEALEDLCKEKYLIVEENKYYLNHLYKAECFISDFIFERIGQTSQKVMEDSHVTTAIEQAQNDLKLIFSHEQRACVELANKSKIMLVTGGPGCGKTTVIRALSRFFQVAKKTLVMAAPTGRAAQRMSQVSDFPSSTIHRLLKFDPKTSDFVHGINDPLIADAIIVDEASMIDLILAKDLFSATARHTSLILVGDKDQLPSVGPGRVFADLLAIRQIPSISLSQIFRRNEESSINTLATEVNAGLNPTVPSPDGVTKSDTYFIPRKTPEEAQSTIVKLVSDQLEKNFGYNLPDITVLTPSNRGPLGTIELNKAIQDKVNSFKGEEEQLEIGDTIFRLGDRVCQRVNNYNIDQYGVYNGDTGTIYSVNRRAKTLIVELWDGRLITYEGSDLFQLQLAYAITVHRSQGAEIPCVVLALHESHFTLLERQLLYTAVTRAKKLLVIVGSRQALTLASKRMTSLNRNTGIKDRIRFMIG